MEAGVGRQPKVIPETHLCKPGTMAYVCEAGFSVPQGTPPWKIRGWTPPGRMG